MHQSASSHRFAFPSMLFGSATLALGPWMVRIADVGPLASGFWRMALAAPLLLLLCPLARQPLPRPRQGAWLLFTIAGLAFAFDLAAWHLGIVRTTMANSVLFGNTTTFFYAAWGFAIARQLPGRASALALVLALGGVMLLMGRSYQLDPAHLGGDLLCIAAALFYTVYLVVIGRLRDRIKPLPTLAVTTAVGAAATFVIAATFEQAIWPKDWTPLIVLALSSQVLGQGLIVYAVGYLQPVVAGLCLLVQPVIAAAIGWIVYGEQLGAPDLAGALMIAAALLLVRRGDAPGASPRETASARPSE